MCNNCVSLIYADAFCGSGEPGGGGGGGGDRAIKGELYLSLSPQHSNFVCASENEFRKATYCEGIIRSFLYPRSAIQQS